MVLAAALTLGACGRKADKAGPPEPGDQAVASVGGETVWASDVRREAVGEGLIAEGAPLEVSSEPFHRALDEVVDQKLLAAEAVRRGLDKDPAVERRLAAARERVLGDMLVEAMVQKAANDSAVKGLYQEQLKLAKQAEEFHARQIVLASQAEADAVRKLIAAGGSFEALALQRSTDTATKFNGGDLGYFTAEVMPAAYAAALKPAKAGQVIGPFKAEAGWVVLKLEDRRPEAPISLEQARPQIVRFLTYDEVRALIERLRGQSQVKLLIGPVQGGGREPGSAPMITPASALSQRKTP
ncbi:peptidylprolyl isomerase [Phenylobacterium montanum]|uniref:peptidylprolyl isomerase n=1 Tax=Phenylobacterium montanum TaxID=2823693 RepID=UPI0034609571